MNLNRQNSPVKSEPSIRTPNGGLIRRAIIWGDNKTKITLQESIAIWEKKKRKTPLAVMIAKMVNESSGKPYISRYEIGQHIDNPNWAWKNEFDSTSYGLFQAMGFHLKGDFTVTDKNNVYAAFTVDRQFDLFDEMMGKHIDKARSLFSSKTEDQIIWHALGGYGGDYTPSAQSSLYFLVEKNYKTYLENKNYKKKVEH